jgi:hypothetical protein
VAQISPWRISVAATSIALATLALLAPTASATFHLMQIREVYPGSVTSPGSEYVELQMYAAGQNHVGGHVLRTYDATGGLVQSNAFLSDVASGANQSTIVMATPEAEAQFGIAADGALSPSGQLNPAGGAVCWESLDCVSWGSFSGSLPSPAGSPATPGGIPDGMALRRTIAPGCPALLEPTDDRDSSTVDFSAVFPAPRPNSVAPSEHACGGGDGGATESPTSQSDGGVLQTKLGRKSMKKTHDRTPTFRFRSSESGSSFQCKLDGKPYRSCRSPFTTMKLALGRHTFKVRARDTSGDLDPSPASYTFKVVAKLR